MSGDKVRFVRGFKPPSRLEAAAAAANPRPDVDRDPADVSRWLSAADGESFSPVPSPDSRDDWLAQYKEDRQSAADFAQENPWLSSERKARAYRGSFDPDGVRLSERYPGGKIYVAQIGDLGNRCQVAPDFDALVRFAQIYLNMPVRNLGKFNLEEEEDGQLFVEVSGLVGREEGQEATPAKRRRTLRRPKQNGRIPLVCRRHKSSLQVHCPSLLSRLKSFIPSDGLCFVALTTLDLYEANPDLFVAGLASGNERVALFSFARYDPKLTFSPEFWYQVEATAEPNMDLHTRRKLVLLRSCKLLVHETGHLLGLAHCVYYACCMNGSGHLKEDFSQPIFLCPVCLRKLGMLSKVNYERRYEELKAFFENHGMTEEHAWIVKRLAIVRRLQ